jgi:hypothetical protein
MEIAIGAPYPITQEIATLNTIYHIRNICDLHGREDLTNTKLSLCINNKG